MSSGVLSALVRSGSVLVASLVMLAGSPSEAFAGGRDCGSHHGGHRGGHHGGHHGGHRGHHGGSGSSFSISIGNHGSSFSAGYRDGYRGGYGGYVGYRNDWCDTRPLYVAPVYCPPPVRYCPPPVVYAPAYCPPAVVVRSAPVYVERPVYVDRPVVVQTVYAPEPPVPPAPVQAAIASSQDRDLGTTYLRLGDLENAARLYQRYLGTYSNDAFAQRGLGLVELGRGNALEGTRWIAAAYRSERSLALSPPSPEGVGGTAVYQRMLDTAVAHVASTPSPEGWLTVAILQHGTGQRDAAQQSMQRAREAGLDIGVLDSMTVAIAR